MRVAYRHDFGDGYTFLLVEAKPKAIEGVDEEKLRVTAEKMHDIARRTNACTFTQALRDEDDNVIIAWGVVCTDCDPESDSDVERMLCEIIRGGGHD